MFKNSSGLGICEPPSGEANKLIPKYETHDLVREDAIHVVLMLAL